MMSASSSNDFRLIRGDLGERPGDLGGVSTPLIVPLNSEAVLVVESMEPYVVFPNTFLDDNDRLPPNSGV